MLRIGCQLSSGKGYLAMGMQATEVGANTFQFFTRNPRGGAVKALDMEDVRAYLAYANEHDICQIMGHAPYTVNPCSAKEDLREFAQRVLCEDLQRLDHVPQSLFVFHPGCHVGQGEEAGITYIAQAIRAALDSTKRTTILLETMAGKGTEIGGSFAHLRDIISATGADVRLGVCLDTCHVHDAGYDVCEDLDALLDEFNEIIGLERLRAIHLNDSKNVRGAKKDRHEKIGEGQIGLEAVVHIVTHPKLRTLPFYLETPNDLDGYKREIEMIRALAGESKGQSRKKRAATRKAKVDND